MQIRNFSFSKQNFQGQKGTQKPILTGLDYSNIDTFSRSNEFKTDFQNATQARTLTKEMIDMIILDRIPRTVERVKNFVSKHTGFDENELIQETILEVAETANKYNGEISSIEKHLTTAEKRLLDKKLAELEQEQAKKSDIRLEDLRTTEDPVIEEIYKIDAKDIIEAKLNTLEPIQNEILRLRYGIDCTPETLEKIGKRYNRSRSRISKIEQEALRIMRHPSRSKMLKAYAE